MSFLLDPPMLVASGVLIERALPEEQRDVAETATLGTFLGASFGLYHNVPGLGMLWRPFRSRNGRDVLPGYGSELLGWLGRAHQVATLGAMVADQGSGRVLKTKRGDAVLLYDITRSDAAKIIVAIEAMGRLMFAAGAVEVLTGLPSGSTVSSVAELQEVLGRTNPKSLHLAAFHPTGTAAAGSDEQVCPVDASGRLHGVDGVWVADASILPGCPSVNPQVSIMALALAVADEIVAARG